MSILSALRYCKTAVVGQPYSTCYDIASTAHISVDSLASYNPGISCEALKLAQTLCISPGTITAPNPDGSCQSYTIVSGDSCYAIGLRFGTNEYNLEALNTKNDNWKGCSKLDAGLDICVSSGSLPQAINPIDLSAESTATSTPSPKSTGKSCTDAITWTKSRMETMWKSYKPSSSDCGCFKDIPNQWVDIVTLEAVVNYMTQSGTRDYYSDIIKSANSNAASPLVPLSFDNGQDDALWGALLYMSIGDFQESIGRSEGHYWDAAIKLVDWVAEDTGHYYPLTTEKCDGGVWWKHNNNDTPDAYKNTITNALFIHTAAKAYMKGYGDKYLKLAKASWEFTRRLRDTDGLYNDGTDSNRGLDQRPPNDFAVNCSRTDTDKWSYNQGTMVSALGSLYKATSNRTYIDEALITLDAITTRMTRNGILVDMCDVTNQSDHYCDNNAVNFKGLTLRHVSYFFDYINDSSILAKYSDWLGQQAKAINSNAYDAKGNVLSVWFEKNSTRSQANGRSDVQRNALDAMLTVMKYGTC